MRYRIAIGLLLIAALPNLSRGQGNPTATPVGDLPTQIEGTSTLFFHDGQLWSCNDHGTLTLYAIDTLTAAIVDSIVFDTNVYDLEEVTQDDRYLYFGDIGDNRGVRTDLHILRMEKELLASGDIRFDTIWFTYPDRTSDSARDFDCEAFIATDTAIILFTKQWLSQGSVCYSIPKVPGHHVAQRIATLATSGLVTGACYQSERQRLVLCGYNMLCAPFVYIVHDFEGIDFGTGQHVHVDLTNGPGWQTEGIATSDGLHYYLTCEKLDAYGLHNPAQLLTLDLSAYLNDDSSQLASPQIVSFDTKPRLSIYPNPAVNRILLPAEMVKKVEVIDTQGHILLSQDCQSEHQFLDLNTLPAASYLLRITLANGHIQTLPFIKL